MPPQPLGLCSTPRRHSCSGSAQPHVVTARPLPGPVPLLNPTSPPASSLLILCSDPASHPSASPQSRVAAACPLLSPAPPHSHVPHQAQRCCSVPRCRTAVPRSRLARPRVAALSLCLACCHGRSALCSTSRRRRSSSARPRTAVAARPLLNPVSPALVLCLAPRRRRHSSSARAHATTAARPLLIPMSPLLVLCSAPLRRSHSGFAQPHVVAARPLTDPVPLPLVLCSGC